METPPLKIGITCFPLIGGSGILATALGTELAARGHEVHFFSHAKPVRLDLSLPRIHFHQVEVGHATVFPCPDYTLPLAVKMAEVGQSQRLDIFHVHYAVPHATAAFLATEMIGAGAPKVVTTLHGTDTTLLGPNPQYRAAIEHALIHSDAVTTVSESLRRQTEETFRLRDEIRVIPNFFTPNPSIEDPGRSAARTRDHRSRISCRPHVEPAPDETNRFAVARRGRSRASRSHPPPDPGRRLVRSVPGARGRTWIARQRDRQGRRRRRGRFSACVRRRPLTPPRTKASA